MSGEVKTEQYRALAELRHQIRQFLSGGDRAARGAGLEPQQYLVLLMIRGLPEGHSATIRTLADRLTLKHHSVVELVDRLEGNGYVRRARARDDRRNVIVSLLPRGERLLEEVARQRIDELRANGHELVRAIDRLLDRRGRRGRSGRLGVVGRRGGSGRDGCVAGIKAGYIHYARSLFAGGSAIDFLEGSIKPGSLHFAARHVRSEANVKKRRRTASVGMTRFLMSALGGESKPSRRFGRDEEKCAAKFCGPEAQRGAIETGRT